MDNKQKRKLMMAIYKTIFFFAIIALGTTIYLCIDKLAYPTEKSILWLDIIMLVYIFFILCFIIADNVSTRKLTNKYSIAKFYYFIFVTSFIDHGVFTCNSGHGLYSPSLHFL